MSEADPAADTFRWRARLWHLTYVGHIPAELLLRQLSSVTKSNTVLGSSVVHEASDAEAPYAHTHLAWLWERAPTLHGARLMYVECERAPRSILMRSTANQVDAAGVHAVPRRAQARRHRQVNLCGAGCWALAATAAVLRVERLCK